MSMRDTVKLKMLKEKCNLPSSGNFKCGGECKGCEFHVEHTSQSRGVSGTDGFGEDDLTARPKGWEPVIPYSNRGTPQENHVIRERGWCPKCKESLEDCICHPVPSIFDEEE